MDNKFTNIKERILQLSDIKEDSKESFFTKIGVTYGNFKGSAKKRPINSNVLENILTIYPDINSKWLLMGHGEMYVSDNVTNEPIETYNLRTDIELDSQKIPLYDIEAVAGLVPLFDDSQNINPIDYISIPNLPKCDGALPITGDSMYPLLKSGDIIMFKKIVDLKTEIFYGEMYLLSIEVAGDEYVMVKFVQKSEEGKDFIKLVSQNQNHQSKDIHVSKIRAMALVKASIRVNSMN